MILGKMKVVPPARMVTVVVNQMTVELPDRSILKVTFNDDGEIGSALLHEEGRGEGVETAPWATDSEKYPIIGGSAEPYTVLLFPGNSICVVIYNGNGQPQYKCIPPPPPGEPDCCED